MKKLLEVIKNKWLIDGTKTLILVAIIIAAYIGVSIVLEKNTLPSIDLTENKLYSLSQETKTKLDNLDKKITIQLINLGNYEYAIEYAKKYEAYSKNIEVEEISDLSTRTDLMTKYNLTSEDSLIVIKTDEKETTLNVDDLYTVDYNTYEQVNLTEEAITNAILGLTLEKKPKIYILTGNNYYETSALNTITEGLKSDANDVEELDLLSKGTMPEDCDTLIITTQKKDISELEKDEIIKYIKKGGKILALTSQSMVVTETPNLDSVFAEYGITLPKGVVFEQDTSRMLSGSPEFIVSSVEPSSEIVKNLGAKVEICTIDPGKIEFADSDKLTELGVTYETIATTSDKAYMRTDFTIQSFNKTDKDEDAENTIVGAIATKTIDENTTSTIAIYSSEIFALDMRIQLNNQYYMYAVGLRNNKDIVLNTVSYLNERTDTITIRKTSNSEKYNVTELQNRIILAIIFIVPIIIIISGIVVWQIRRRRK